MSEKEPCPTCGRVAGINKSPTVEEKEAFVLGWYSGHKAGAAGLHPSAVDSYEKWREEYPLIHYPCLLAQRDEGD